MRGATGPGVRVQPAARSTRVRFHRDGLARAGVRSELTQHALARASNGAKPLCTEPWASPHRAPGDGWGATDAM
ncbi:conserved hypothetical protein [Ricinus communis]|uniref:Uncharacterized protein n=1 Tax=Ricinus communis TaxID=3988 RepID=B9TBX7_RICCO|nr:conserved hypothetical protein [Ricinus communis]